MADNITIDTITGSPVARTDDVGGIHYQIIKIAHGADGSVDGIVSAGSPMPITGSITVSANALPTGAATEATLSTLNGKVTACNTGAVTVAASALPSGAATEATLSALNAKITAANTGAVVIASSALPSGAATAAKQPALGTAGTASADVISVQGIASMTPILVNGSGVTQPVSDAGGSLTVDAPVGTPVFVRLSDGSSAIATLPVSLASLPALAAGTNNIGDVDVLTLPALAAGSNVIGAVTQSGTWNVGTVTTVTAVTAITNALPAGTNAIGKLAANSGVDIGDVDVTSISAGTNLIGDVGLQGRTGNGLTPYRSVDVDETKFQIKGSAGTLQSIHAMNMTAAVLYLHVYDQVSASVTVGTTTPAFTFPLPTNADTNGCGFVCNFGLPGAAFANGITMAVTTTIGGTSGPASNGVFCNGLYK